MVNRSGHFGGRRCCMTALGLPLPLESDHLPQKYILRVIRDICNILFKERKIATGH
jgi:hypothetical protein